MPSMRFSKQRCIACCFSGGWLFTILFLKSEKYWGREGKDGLICRGTAPWLWDRACLTGSSALTNGD